MTSENYPWRIYHVKSNISFPQNPSFHVMHWHKEVQFSVVTRGKLIVETMGNREMIAENQVLFINRDTPHCIVSTNDAQYTSLLFPIEALFTTIPDVRLQLEKFTTDGHLPTFCLSRDTAWQSSCMHMIQEAIEETNSLRMSALLLSIMSILITRTEQPAIHARTITEQRTETMMKCIAEHFGDDISLSEIADSAGISKTEANRCFKAVLSTTPYQYLLETRLEHACHLLVTTTLSIHDIAMQCGFHEDSLFGSSFRKRTGMTPLQYRRKKAV